MRKFEEYFNAITDALIPPVKVQRANMDMLEDLATHIEELEKKMEVNEYHIDELYQANNQE